MPIIVSANISTDPANSLTLGTDNGLWTPPRSIHGWTIENFMAPSGVASYFLMPSTGTTTNVSLVGGTAWIWPVTFTRKCSLGQAYLNVTTAGASSTIYTSVYTVGSAGAPGAPGYPDTKLIDAFAHSGATVGSVAATSVLLGSFVFNANQVYWFCTWAAITSAVPSMTMRNSTGQPVMMTAAPVASNFTGSYLSSYLDTTSGWATKTAAPSAPSINSASSSTVNAAYAPQMAFSVTNV